MTKEIPVSQVLQKFVGVDSYREWMRRPFRLNGYCYASNGHWIVRVVDAPEIDADPYGGDHPKKVEALFDEAVNQGFVSLPGMKAPPKCVTCDGSGRGRRVDCDCCAGQGAFNLHGYEYDCKACDGVGFDFYPSAAGADACPDCEGYGIQHVTSGLQIGPNKYAPRYVWLLRDLPDIKFAPGSTEKPAHFTFTGGDGLLMPYRD